jgi:hypothetical protein
MTFTRLYGCAQSTQPSQAICLSEPLPLGDGYYVLARGQIERQSAEHLANMASEFPKGTTIVLQSLGGDLLGGLMLGQYIRAREFNTYVPDDASIQPGFSKCISACAYTFLGGVQRRVASRADFGVHQFRSKENTLDAVQTQKITAALGKYMDGMNVSRNLLDQALMTEPGKVNLIAEHNRKSWRVETEFEKSSATTQTPTTLWKIETSVGGKKLAYQSKKQSSSGAIVTVAWAQFNGQMKLLLIIKPDPSQEGSTVWGDLFAQRTNLKITINSKVFTLSADSDWARAGRVNTEGTRQIWYVVPAELLAQIGKTQSFTLQSLWRTLPNGLDLETTFVTTGLADLLNSLY